MRRFIPILVFLLAVSSSAANPEFIFPTDQWHNHSSTIVELPNGDLLTAWYKGSGEGKADDVRIVGARKRMGDEGWSDPFLMADSQDLPDLNPALFMDPRGVLWMFWVTVLDNSWGGVLLKYRTSTDYLGEGPPRWNWQDVVHCRPRDFERIYSNLLDRIEVVRAEHIQANPELARVVDEQREAVSDKLSRRLGWMTRTQPLMVSEKRMILGVYHDVFACSLAAITDNWGETWSFSEPIVAPFLGLVQPSSIQRQDGTLVAYMRDNGFLKQIRVSESSDRGVSWTEARPLEMPNPGSSLQVLKLKSGNWVLVCNDLKKGRYRLTVFLSEDEGETWPWKRPIEDLGEGGGEVSYPTLIQGKDGSLHCTYSYESTDGSQEAIEYFHLAESWIREGPQ